MNNTRNSANFTGIGSIKINDDRMDKYFKYESLTLKSFETKSFKFKPKPDFSKVMRRKRQSMDPYQDKFQTYQEDLISDKNSIVLNSTQNIKFKKNLVVPLPQVKPSHHRYKSDQPHRTLFLSQNNFLDDKQDKLSKILQEMNLNKISIQDLNIKKSLHIKKQPIRQKSPEDLPPKTVEKINFFAPSFQERMQNYQKIHKKISYVKHQKEEPIINHIKVNKQIQNRHHKIQKISLLQRSLINEIDQEYSQNIKKNIEEFNRDRMLQSQLKWPNFKVKKLETIEKYIEKRKNILKVRSILAVIQLSQVVRKSHINIKMQKQRIQKLNRLMYSTLRIFLWFKAHMRKWGEKKLEGRQNSQIRSTFVLFGNLVARQPLEKQGSLYYECLRILKFFIKRREKKIMIRRFVIRCYSFGQNVGNLHDLFHQIIQVRKSKMVLLKKQWDSLLKQLYQKATKELDFGMLIILKHIREVPEHIVEYLLYIYLKQCYLRHTLAFIQWRLFFSKNRKESRSSYQMEDQEVQAIVDERIQQMYSQTEEMFNQISMMDETVKFGALTVIKQPYFDDDPKPWTLDNFSLIGWPDPFPKPMKNGKFKDSKPSHHEIQSYKALVKKKNKKYLSLDMNFQAKGVNIEHFKQNIGNFQQPMKKKKKKKIHEVFEDGTDLVYPIERYQSEYIAPLCIYIPSDELLFKLMRSCIGCDYIEDLWIYKD